MMSSEELQELHEHAEHARHTGMARVSLTMAVLAVLVAAVSLLGHRTSTDELILQNRITDQWAYFQAKSIRRHADQSFVDLVSVLTARDKDKDKGAEQIAKVREKYQAEVERYRDDQNELEAEAKKLEVEAEKEYKRVDRYDLGEVFLEIALVVTSITLLSGRRAFWYAGLVIGAVGALIAATGLLMH
jgi:Skp family chaperone for outer membrane proteins